MEDDDDIDSMAPHDSLLGSKTDKQDVDIPFCGCISIRYYQPYFDVDTADVISRLYRSTIYCRAEKSFMSTIADKPDAYGPFWISTSLIFTLAVTSHINSWMASWLYGKNWQYDFNSVVSIASVVYGFTVASTLLVWFLFRQLETNTSLITVLCVYGYSLFVFIPASIICLAPSELVSWLSLTVAAASSGLFLVRNFGPIVIQYANSRASIIIGCIGLIPSIFMLTLKLGFYNTSYK